MSLKTPNATIWTQSFRSAIGFIHSAATSSTLHGASRVIGWSRAAIVGEALGRGAGATMSRRRSHGDPVPLPHENVLGEEQLGSIPSDEVSERVGRVFVSVPEPFRREGLHVGHPQHRLITPDLHCVGESGGDQGVVPDIIDTRRSSQDFARNLGAAAAWMSRLTASVRY
jgi:hypothetical protein